MAEEINFEEESMRLYEADPFMPFTIVVTSGDRYEVNQRRQLAMLGNTGIVLLPKQGMRMFRKNQIVAVHVNEPAT